MESTDASIKPIFDHPLARRRGRIAQACIRILAQAFLCRPSCRFGRTCSSGSPPDFFPQISSSRLRRWPVSWPAQHDLPLSRWSTTDLVREVQRSGLVASISGSTLWRWLHEDAIRPWYHRSWVFPRDPDFAAKAGRVLDLYDRQWQGEPLKPDEFVISADEKTSI